MRFVAESNSFLNTRGGESMCRKRKPCRNKKGFSLIEIIIVISIISILTSIALPRYLSYRSKAFNSAALSDIRELRTKLEAYYGEWRSYPN